MNLSMGAEQLTLGIDMWLSQLCPDVCLESVLFVWS